jgi:hypothetical protein
MISEQVFYLFLFPWIIFIATIPGSVMTYLFAGLAAQLLNYLPEKPKPMNKHGNSASSLDS